MNCTDHQTYIVTEDVLATISWLLAHADCYDRLQYDTFTQTLVVEHANGKDIIKVGHYLNARYGILITSG